MNKTQLIKHVSKETKIDEKTVRLVFNTIIKTIKEKLHYGLNIKIDGFVNFILKINRKREIRNPQNGKKIIVPKRYGLQVKVSRSFKEYIQTKDVY